MKRTIVGLKKGNGKFTIPKFSECLLEYFSKNANSALVQYELENGILVLNENENGFELRHSPECPIKLLPDSHTLELDANKNSSFNRNIGVAASVLIESSDSHILLTKRSAQMRSSPNVWVLPGGHLEDNETVFEAGVREVKEETGLDISHEKASILGIWENVYPLLLGAGSPKTHTLVVYMYTQINKTHDQLIKNLVPDPEEVDSFCWLNYATLNKLLSQENFSIQDKQYFYENGNIIEKKLDCNKMFNKWLQSQPEPYSGVNYALRKWMKIINKESQSCKF